MEYGGKKEQERFGTFSWIERPSSLESLVLVSIFILIMLVLYRVYLSVFSTSQVRNSAVQLADVLRNAESRARDQNKPVSVLSTPAIDGRASKYVVTQGAVLIDRTNLPDGVSIAGEVVFDGQGVPEGPCAFNVSGLSSRLQVLVDEKGHVSVP